MMKCECYCVTEIDDEYIADCQTPEGCNFGEKTVWDEEYLKAHNIKKKEPQDKRKDD